MTDLFQEPPINPDDTHPTQTMPQVLLNDRPQGVSMWRRAMGLFSLLGAVGFTIGAVVVLMSSDGSSPDPTSLPPTQMNTQVAVQASSEAPTDIPATDAPQTTPVPVVATEVISTLDPQTIDSLLVNPVQMVSDTTGVQVQAQRLDPFTIIPDRPRNEIITYTVVQGDNIRSIADRFSLEPETIAWSNDRRIIQVLRPGDTLNIPPVDGVLITAVGTTTIGEYASQYKIDDPFIVIDSPFNVGLFGATPESVPPIGSQIFFPGGEGEAISWTPTVVREGGGADGSSSGGNFITFAPGQAGSCGQVANPGGGAAWSRPIGPSTLTQGFSTWHTGIDYAAPEGSPVYAANGGRVIFVGWNSYGYGYMIALAHGPFTTLYGHLSAYNVSCGQDVTPGQQIGSVGNSGRSSGPHLHFELRYLDTPTNPALTIPG